VRCWSTTFELHFGRCVELDHGRRGVSRSAPEPN